MHIVQLNQDLAYDHLSPATILTVRIVAGLNVAAKRKRVNLSVLRRKTRGGRKQGLDSVELCALDSVKAKRQEVDCSCTVLLCHIYHIEILLSFAKFHVLDY